MAKRKIIKIDEKKCTGCGLCIPNCPEGAIQIIDGKAHLISDLFCDGLGVCLGHCPEGAITIEEREAEKYDGRKVMANIKVPHEESEGYSHSHGFSGCPGSKVMNLSRKEAAAGEKDAKAASIPSQLSNWPVQIMLVPPFAPYLQDADLLIAADCVPFAYADFHRELLKGKILLVGCPKLDDAEIYKQKFSQIFQHNDIKSVTYAHMEVPCCFGLISIIKEAISASGKDIPFKEVVISIKGEKLK